MPSAKQYAKRKSYYLNYNKTHKDIGKLYTQLWRKKSPLHHYNQGVNNAKRRNIVFTINFNDYIVIQRICTYCEKDFKFETGFGLDRKDNSKGYTLDNVVACCGKCNSIKGNNLTFDEMKIAMQAINKFRGNNV